MKSLDEMTERELEQELHRRKKEREKQKAKEKQTFEKEKDEFIEFTVNKFQVFHEKLKEIKGYSIEMASHLYKKMYELNGKEPKEPNQFSLMNAEGDKKIVVERQEHIKFTEESKVAIDGIKEFFRKKFAARSKMVYDILDKVLMKNTKGEYDPKLLTKLRKQVNEINDPELTENFELLESCQQVVGSSIYVRAYQKDDKGKWQDIVLQFSAL